MIKGIGLDCVDVARIVSLITSKGDAFLNRIFTAGEQSYANSKTNSSHTYAKRFAAKEAFVKAVQTHRDGISWLDIEVKNHESGAPYLCLHGKALEILNDIGVNCKSHLSLTDTDTVAQAIVILEDTA